MQLTWQSMQVIWQSHAGHMTVHTGHMAVTCRSHDSPCRSYGSHMQVTWQLHACHMYATWKTYAGHMTVTCSFSAPTSGHVTYCMINIQCGAFICVHNVTRLLPRSHRQTKFAVNKTKQQQMHTINRQQLHWLLHFSGLKSQILTPLH